MNIFEKIIAPLFERHRGEWLAEARTAAMKLGETHPVVTINMVREICPPPSNVDPRVMGAVFPRKVWERLGYTVSTRKISHGRPIAQFRLRGYAMKDKT